MAMKILSVDISNIRVHEKTQFTPADSGITAIMGPNGSGKSTILNAIAWVLYGTKPPMISRIIDLYRYGATMPEDKCYATVQMDIDGTVYEIQRRIVNKKGGTECDVWKVDDNGDKQHLAGPGSSHASPYIRSLMKMDQQGFLSAVFVQQKQIDNIVNAKPADRAQVIEKLTGVSGVSKSLEFATKERNAIKRDISNITLGADGHSLESLRKKASAGEQRIAKGDALIERVNREIEESEAKEREAKKALEEYQSRERELTSIENTIALHEKDVSWLSPECDKLKERHKNVLDEISTVESVGSYETIKSMLDDAVADQEKCVSVLSECYAQRKKLEESIESCNVIIARYGKSETDAQAEVEKFTTMIAQCDSTTKTMHEVIARQKSVMESCRHAVSALSETDGTCPTCLQKAEEPDVAIGVLTQRGNDAQEEIERSEQTLNETATARSEYVVSLETAQKVVESFTVLQRDSTELSSYQSRIRRAEKKKKDVDLDVENYRELFSKASRVKSLMDTRDDISAELRKRMSELTDAQTKLKEAKSKKQLVKPLGENTIDNAKSTVESLSQSIRKNHAVLARAQELKTEISVEVENCRARIAEEERNVENYNSLLSQHAEMETVVSSLRAFKEHLVEESVPALESHASELLSKFTNDAYNRVSIFPTYDISVYTQHGEERAIGQLSGGELSAVAMALRFAISLMLGGKSGVNLMILDEVLVSQDEERSANILMTLKSITEGQVIIVAHNDSIDTVVDKVVELT